MSFYGELLDQRKNGENDVQTTQGILLGEVTENWDSDHPGMVRVQMMLGEEGQNDLGWVPVAASYAGNEFGSYLLPEIGMQVILAFHLGNLKSPYVIGCLWNQFNVLPQDTANENNSIKTLITKGGNQIAISDEEGKEKISIQTKGGLTFELEDENQKMSMQDKNAENMVIIDAKEGVLTLAAKKQAVFKVNGQEMLHFDGSGKKIALNADQISVESGQKLELKGQNTSLEGSSMKISGQNINLEAQASLALKGSASFKAESSGIMELKGSMMKLN